MALDDWPYVATSFRRLELETGLLVWPFFLLMVFMLSFVTVNLVVATITYSYMANRKEERLKRGLAEAHQVLFAVLAGGKAGAGGTLGLMGHGSHSPISRADSAPLQRQDDRGDTNADSWVYYRWLDVFLPTAVCVAESDEFVS